MFDVDLWCSRDDDNLPRLILPWPWPSPPAWPSWAELSEANICFEMVQHQDYPLHLIQSSSRILNDRLEKKNQKQKLCHNNIYFAGIFQAGTRENSTLQQHHFGCCLIKSFFLTNCVAIMDQNQHYSVRRWYQKSIRQESKGSSVIWPNLASDCCGGWCSQLC